MQNLKQEHIERFYLNYINKHGDNLSFYRSMKSNKFCYRPDIDACIISDLPQNIDPNGLIGLWNDWFSEEYSRGFDASRIKQVSENIVLRSILTNNPHLLIPYEIFQHEIRAHRLPIIFSTTGLLLAALEFIANSKFIHLLELKKENKLTQNQFKRYQHGLKRIEKKLYHLITSMKYVVESLAVFRDIIILSQLYEMGNQDHPLEKAIHFVNSVFQERKKDPYCRFYATGLNIALTVFKNLGFWGVEVATYYALNPELTLADITGNSSISPILRLDEIAKLNNTTIPASLNFDNPYSIDKFIRAKFDWQGFTHSKFSSLNMMKSHFPEIVETGFPSLDVFCYPDSTEPTVLPEFIFVTKKKQKSYIAKSKGLRLDKLLKNFFVSILRTYAERIISTGKIETKMCPLFYLFRDCKSCFKETGCSIITQFCDSYGLTRVSERK